MKGQNGRWDWLHFSMATWDLFTGEWDFVTGNGRPRILGANGFELSEVMRYDFCTKFLISNISCSLLAFLATAKREWRSSWLTYCFWTSKLPINNIPTSNTASLARIDFPKPLSTNAITRKEDAQIRHWATTLVNVSGTGTQRNSHRFARPSA